MNVFALLSLLSCITSVSIGVFVYNLKKRDSLNRIFMITVVVNAVWAFAEFMYRQADLPSTAYLWIKVASFIWPVGSVLVLHFALVYTKSKFLGKKISYLIMYAPAVMFSYIDITTDLLGAQPILEYWGYTYAQPATNWVNIASSLWVTSIAALALLLCTAYYLKLEEKTEKQQAKFVTLGLSVPAIIAVTTQLVLPQLGFEVPELGNIFGVALSAFVGCAIWKYGLFTLDPALLADKIISTMPDALVLSDAQGKILTVNKALLDFLEYRQDEIVGKQIDQFYDSSRDKSVSLAETLASRTFKGHEIKVKTKAGVQKFALLSSSALTNSRGQKIGIVCVLQDITGRKNMEAKLLKSERFASIGELAGMVGHDLRNPLMGIRSATYVLKTKYGGGMDEAGKKMLANIDRAIDYSDKIVSDLLDYSREIKLEFSSGTPRSLVSSALALVEVPQRIQVQNFAEDTPEFKVDKAKIDRVFVNIIKNAIDAIPQTGALTITSVTSAQSVEIVFKDTGTGITPETMKNIWTPLFTTKAKGMGFGLAICKRIVEAHEGKILVTSQNGEGTEFRVIFPNKPFKQLRDPDIIVLSDLLQKTLG